MSFPRWLTVWAWSLFGLIALAPVLRLTTLGWADGFALSNWTAIPWRLLGASVLIAGGSSALALLFGVPCAWLCARTDLWAGKAWSVACLIPLLIPPYLHALAWKKAWADAGLLGKRVRGDPPSPWTPGSASGDCRLGCAYFPLVMLSCSAG
ncbi:MAG: hypothetical protein IPM75_15085 [Candidatus Competibacteraceae bacterium]|nr:hypothetical protein [Candidatus Competibacteraceae bacterium]